MALYTLEQTRTKFDILPAAADARGFREVLVSVPAHPHSPKLHANQRAKAECLLHMANGHPALLAAAKTISDEAACLAGCSPGAVLISTDHIFALREALKFAGVTL